MTAIPALPDAERRTQYSPAGSAGPFDVGFAIYEDGDDYQTGSFVEVWLNDVKLVPGTDWTLDSPSGTLSMLARPITDARVTLTVPATGTLQIASSARPRRLTQLTEGRGVTADTFNRIATEETAYARDFYDRVGRTPIAPPGSVIGPLPGLSARQGGGAGTISGYDNNGDPIALPIGTGAAGLVAIPTDAVDGAIIAFSDPTAATVKVSTSAAYSYATVALAAAATISAPVTHVRTGGFNAAGDGGGALYARVNSEPSHPGKFQSVDGAWWELAEPIATPLMFGAVADGADTMDGWQVDPLAHIRGDWATATSYAVNDIAWDASTLVGGIPKRYGYRCLVAHTSGTLATDIAGGKWIAGAFSGTDNAAAFQDWFNYCAAKTSCHGKIPAGTYRISDVEAAAGLTPGFQRLIDLGAGGCDIEGSGKEVTTLLIDEDVDWTISQTSGNRSTDALFGNGQQADFNINAKPMYAFRHFGIRGRWLHRPGGNTTDQAPNGHGIAAFVLSGAGFTMKDMLVTDIRNKLMRNFDLSSITVEDCWMQRCARGFVKCNSVTGGRIIVSRNRMIEGDDDCVDIGGSDANIYGTLPASVSCLVSDNHIEKTQNIILGLSRDVTVRGNIMSLINCGGSAIEIGAAIGSSNNQPLHGVVVADNVVSDVILEYSAATGTVLTNNTNTDGIINVGGAGRSIVAGDTSNLEGVYPGDYQPTAQSFLSEITGNRELTTSTLALRSGPAGRALTIHHNVIKRTLQDTTNYSGWRKGLLFNQAGFVDPAYATTNFAANGIILAQDMIGASIDGNVIDGLPGHGIRFYGALSLKRIDMFKAISVNGNVLRKLGGGGITKDKNDPNIDYWSLVLSNNIVDIDPLHTNALRNTTTPLTGKWQGRASNIATGCGMHLQNLAGASVLNNTFLNCQAPVDWASGGGVEKDNIVYGTVNAFGYDAANVGVGTMPKDEGYVIVTRISVPTSASYGQVTILPQLKPVTASLASGSGVSLSSNTVTTVLSLSIPHAGTWDVIAQIEALFTGGTSPTVSRFRAAVNITTGSFPTADQTNGSIYDTTFPAMATGGALSLIAPLAVCRIYATGPTTVYALAYVTLGGSGQTVVGFGNIRARLVT